MQSTTFSRFIASYLFQYLPRLSSNQDLHQFAIPAFGKKINASTFAEAPLDKIQSGGEQPKTDSGEYCKDHFQRE